MRHTAQDLDILARTLFGEAKAHDQEDAQAIACVILNRVNLRNWPNTVKAVCLQPWQFSCWNNGDPNRERILNAQGKWWEECQRIAKMALEGKISDFTERSTHYHTHAMELPRWARGKKKVFDTTAHAFYNDIDTPPPQSAKDALDQVRPIATTRTAKAATVAASATVVAPVLETMSQVAQAGTLAQQISDIAPWVLAAIGLAAIGWIIWARIDDRRNGLR